jgi:cell division protein FtsB
MKLCISKILIIINLYITYQTILGKEGIAEYYKMKKIKSSLILQTKIANQEINEVYHDLMLLDKNMMNLDFVDEVMHKRLNYSNEKEKIITYKLELLDEF